MTPLILSRFGIWTLGTLDVISLIAATTNAFYGALLARRPVTKTGGPIKTVDRHVTVGRDRDVAAASVRALRTLVSTGAR